MKVIAESCGIDARQAEVAFDALQEDGHLEIDGVASGVLNGHVSRVTGKARREVGAWPTAEGVIDQLVAALSAAADVETEPDRKSRLRQAAETLGSTGYRIALDVTTKWAEHKAGVRSSRRAMPRTLSRVIPRSGRPLLDRTTRIGQSDSSRLRGSVASSANTPERRGSCAITNKATTGGNDGNRT